MLDNYNKLLKQSVDLSYVKDDNQRKKRKKNPPNNSAGEEITNGNSVIEIIGSSSEEDDFDSEEFEDVDINAQPVDEHVANESEEFHLVGFTDQDLKDAHNVKDDLLTIKLNNFTDEVKITKKKSSVVSKEERHRRIIVHKLCLVSMLMHGQYRNSWCNNRDLQKVLQKVVSKEIRMLLEPKANDSQTDLTKSRRFLDGLRKLMYVYSSKLQITHQGLLYKDWGELGKYQPRKLRDVNFTKFKELIKSHRGSRDIAAQGFVILLRSLKLNARLVFSLQPPDFTLISMARGIGEQHRNRFNSPSVHEKEEVNSSKLLSSRSRILQSTRFGKQSNQKEGNITFIDSEYPIFWAEVWDRYSKRWISIDAVSLKTIEQVPMRRRSKFQPALNEPRNQLTYVIAYDKFGGIRDVTRRYAQFYNAKTSKKRIDNRSEEDKTWYNSILRAMNKLNRRRDSNNMKDVLEAKEFHDRDLCEGMPNNMSDFHNHPIYALKSQLKQNEIVYPDNDTSVCGYFRPKTSGKSNNKQNVIPVIKRSNIYSLKSARAWYMVGRVIKPGEQPLRVKSRSKKQESDIIHSDTEDQDVRLYADFQTKLYIPPPIEDGKVPKNAYGNIDIYTPSMIPENGCLIQSSDFSMKVAEYAAKLIGIDYAKAIVSFQFGKAKKSFSHSAKPTEGGIVIDAQYKDALIEVMESIKEEEQEYERLQLKLQSLRLWKFFLSNLRISRRLDSTHGLIEDTATTSAKDAYVRNEKKPHSITQSSGKYAEIVGISDEVGPKLPEYSDWASSENERGNGVYPGVKGQPSNHALDHDGHNESDTSDSDVDMAGGFFAESDPDPEEPEHAPMETLGFETEKHYESSKPSNYEVIQEEASIADHPSFDKDNASYSDRSSGKGYSSNERAAATIKVPEKKFDQSKYEEVNRTDTDFSSLSEASGPPSGGADYAGSNESFEFQYSDSE